MARRILPSQGERGWTSKMNDAIDSITDQVDNQAQQIAQLQATSGGGAASTPGGVAFDSFTGANDDAKLTAALSYAAAQTIKPHIFFTNRQYSFSQTNRQVFSGMKLSGLGGHGNQQRSANSIPNDIRFTGNGTWWVLPSSGNIFDVYIGGLSFQGNQNANFMTSGGSVLWTSVFRDLGFNLWRHVLGTATQSFPMTGNLFDGWWNTNNSYNTAYHIGGSDCNLWLGHHLLDSPPSLQGAYNGNYHIWFDFMEKTTVGPMFITGEGVSGMRITGGSNRNGGLVLMGNGRSEGRNGNQPCLGSCIMIDSGGVSIDGWSVNYGMTAPNNSLPGHSGQGGIITIKGGEVVLRNLWYDRATGVAETLPFIYQSGGYLRVHDIMRGFKNSSWSGRPRFQSIGGTYTVDNSVTVI